MKKTIKLLPLLATIFLASCGNTGNSRQVDNDTTEIVAHTDTIECLKLWSTDTLMTTSESVFYHETSKQIFVSNIGAVPPGAKDGDGWIAKIDSSGQIIEQDWVNELDAPKGMACVGEYLYVTNIKELVKIKIETGEIENRYVIDTAQSLNDATSIDDEVYFSDSNTGAIYLLKDENITLFATIEGEKTNGLLAEADRILAVTFDKGNFIAINKTKKTPSVLAKGIKGGDGIVSINQGYIVSSWNGEIYFINKTGNTKPLKILDTKEHKLNSADICIIADKNILLVPTFFGNTVDAYELIVK